MSEVSLYGSVDPLLCSQRSIGGLSPRITTCWASLPWEVITCLQEVEIESIRKIMRIRASDTGHITSTMRRAAHPSGRARCGAGAGCSAINYQPLITCLSMSPVTTFAMLATRSWSPSCCLMLLKRWVFGDACVAAGGCVRHRSHHARRIQSTHRIIYCQTCGRRPTRHTIV